MRGDPSQVGFCRGRTSLLRQRKFLRSGHVGGQGRGRGGSCASCLPGSGSCICCCSPGSGRGTGKRLEHGGVASRARTVGGGAASKLGGVYLHRLPEQVAVRANGLPQPQPHAGALRRHLAGAICVPVAGRLRPQKPAAAPNPLPSAQLLWLRGLHQPLSAEQYGRHLPAGQGDDHAGHRAHPECGLRQDLCHPHQAHFGEKQSRVRGEDGWAKAKGRAALACAC